MDKQISNPVSGANRPRAAELMATRGLAALVATTPENINYILGSQLRASNWTMQIYAVLPRKPETRPCVIIPTNRLGVIAQLGITGADLYVYSDFFVEGSVEGKPSTPDIDLFTLCCRIRQPMRGRLKRWRRLLKILDSKDKQ